MISQNIEWLEYDRMMVDPAQSRAEDSEGFEALVSHGLTAGHAYREPLRHAPASLAPLVFFLPQAPAR